MKILETNSQTPDKNFVYKPTRRRFLHGMGLACVAPFLPSFLPEGFAAVDETGVIPPHDIRFTTRNGRDPGHCVVMLFMQGGLSWEDTFDRKPDSPFREINIPDTGIKISELLRPLAGHMRDAIVINNLYGGNGFHDFGAALSVTGSGRVRNNFFYAEALNPNPFVEFSRMLTDGPGNNVGYVVLHQSSPDTNGFNRAWNKPWDALKPNAPETVYSAIDLRTGEFTDPMVNDGNFDRNRHRNRMNLLEVLDRQGHTLTGPSVEKATRAYRAANNILGSELQTSYNLREETPETLARYGNTKSGKQMLLARRMLQRGVRFVIANHGNNDLHYGLREDMPGLMGPFAQALNALLDDIKRMRDKKISVVIVSEFGRAPRFNHGGMVNRGGQAVYVTPGRDHWTNAYSMVVFGNDIRGGRTIGRNRNGNIIGNENHASVIGETILELLKVGRFETRTGNRFPYIDLNRA